MGKTRRKEITKNILRCGRRGHHNTLVKEFKTTQIEPIKNYRGLIDERDYQSYRMKRLRCELNGKRRARMKEIVRNEVENNIGA